MAKKLSGGGITSNKLVHPSTRTGSPRKGSSPASADQLGQSTAFPKENVEARPGYNSGVKLGNEKALDVGKGGVGTGRTTYKCGSQNQYGPANPGHTAPARDFLSEFGPEKSKG
jgi:hypothetical protein